MNKAIIMKKAIEGEYCASYFRIDDHRWCSVAESTRVQEIEYYGGPNERLLPVDQGAGLIWRVRSISKYEERDEGVFMQMEAIVLSRDVPKALRWIVNPIVRRVSRDSLQLLLEQTRGAVQSNAARVEALVPGVGSIGFQRTEFRSATAPICSPPVPPLGDKGPNRIATVAACRSLAVSRAFSNAA